MEPSPQNQKRKLRISLTAMAVTVLAAIAFFVLVSKSITDFRIEQARFAKVLKEASDEELFTVLNYAIASHYVPNRDIDPFLISR